MEKDTRMNNASKLEDDVLTSELVGAFFTRLSAFCPHLV
jgi:hypothetical protein